MNSFSISGRELVSGLGSGPLLASQTGLSFWGGVDVVTSAVVDHTHPLHGQRLAGSVLAIPNGRGSCTGSQALLELLLNGVAPAAIVLREPDFIVALGVIVAEELFAVSIPVVSVGEESFEVIWSSGANFVKVQNGEVSAHDEKEISGKLVSQNKKEIRVAPKFNIGDLELSTEERAILEGSSDGQKVSEAHRIALRIVARVASIQGAPRLIRISQAHIDGCCYIGPGGLRFAQMLVELGGRVVVPTTLNAISADRRYWKDQGVDEELGKGSAALADAYVTLGASPSFTCAPYLLQSAPTQHEDVAWGESNAVIFANSVLGARTQKYADYLDICAALTGKAPAAGAHLESGRSPSMRLDVSEVVRDHGEALLGGQDRDSFFSVLGYLCGHRCGTRVPLIDGLEAVGVTRDQLKSFSAALGTSSAVPLFHMTGVTPKRPEVTQKESDTAAQNGAHALPTVCLTVEDLSGAWLALDVGAVPPQKEGGVIGVRGESEVESAGVRQSGADKGGEGADAPPIREEEGESESPTQSGTVSQDSGGEEQTCTSSGTVDLIALGNPHFSLEETASLAALVRKRCGLCVGTAEGSEEGRFFSVKKREGVRVIITLGREVLEQAEKAGHASVLKYFGVEFVTDTCWCFPSVLPAGTRAVMTNSAKYAHYAPGLAASQGHPLECVRFGSLSACVDAAVSDQAPSLPAWVSNFAPRSRLAAVGGGKAHCRSHCEFPSPCRVCKSSQHTEFHW
uniref:Aconitase X catalytic domain-containing protein n=1 Tax=Chromera velia CCMP2878 TaxID=1169474 RepID=A0A0G4FV56_9ALVE|eukprot:Cvel_3791.t1-p1 / transcript=Cvel_3791.t1 / gene=Cvel_3791 / organism=Chromera_velia_CCMP2878 / gene_product=Uncharacterized protein MTH_1421, putative / transcript_product=Uncharacterized protein MTH_1421, putative / location=Cvel_scaffold159:70518-72734(-) / protein_length=739 / sequence_SO=supercontig / SO=protein_coding / is_pseudo=false